MRMFRCFSRSREESVPAQGSLGVAIRFARVVRFDGVFFVDLPGREQKDGNWAIRQQYYGLDAKQARPDDARRTGAEIKSCSRLASLLDVPLVQAAQNVVPVAGTAGDRPESLRQWASGRCLSADRAGVYSRSECVSDGRVRRVVRKSGLSRGTVKTLRGAGPLGTCPPWVGLTLIGSRQAAFAFSLRRHVAIVSVPVGVKLVVRKLPRRPRRSDRRRASVIRGRRVNRSREAIASRRPSPGLIGLTACYQATRRVFIRRCSTMPRAPVTMASAMPSPAGSISGTADGV